MVEFYRGWRIERRRPAVALRCAQQWLRDVTAGELRAVFEPLLDGHGWLPAEAAEILWEQALLAETNERIFAPPSSWAAFIYSGS